MSDIAASGPIHRPLIKINGAALSAEMVDSLLDCRIELAVGRAGQAVLRFFDPEFRLIDDALFTVGKAVTIDLANTANSLKRTFEGEMLSIGLEMGPNDEPILTVTAFDHSHRLARNSASMVHANKKYSDLVTSIASEVGMQADCPSTSTVFPYLLQTTNGAALLNEICERTGMVWWAEGKKLIMKKPVTGSATVILERGRALRRVRAVSSGGTVTDEVKVRSWDAKNKTVIVGASSAKPAALSSTSLVSGTRTGAGSFAASKRLSTNRPSLSADEANAVAASMHQRTISDELNLRAESEGNADIKVGGTVQLKGLGTRLSGTYFVTSVEHVYSANDYRTKFTSAGTTPSTLVDLLGAGGSVPWHRMGPVAGVVSDLGKGDFVGLVKVKLALLGDNVVTNWARLLAPGAGATRGSLMMPSINDEVLVMFEDGDVRRPVVIGALWNGKDKQPDEAVVKDGKVVTWVTKSPKGHTFTFSDGEAEDKQSVVIALMDPTAKLNVGMDKVELFAKDKTPLQLKANSATITITDKGDIEIKATNIKLTADKDVEITGANVKITGNSTAVMKGNSSVEVSGAQVKVAGQGMTEIKGGIVKIN